MKEENKELKASERRILEEGTNEKIIRGIKLLLF